MKKLLLSMTDWVAFLAIGLGFGFMIGFQLMRERVTRTEADMCSTALLLTQTARDTIGLVTSRSACVRYLSQGDVNVSTPYDTTQTALTTERP